MESAFSELRRAAERLRATPGTTLLMVLTLALGLGAVTAIFGFADTVLFRSLPFDQPDRLVRIFNVIHATGEDRGAASFPDFFDWQEQSETLEQIGGFVRWNYNVSAEGSPQRIWGSMASHTLFATMGAEPVLGRTILPEEDRPGAEKVVVLSHALWQRNFAADPGVVGKVLRLDDLDHRIIGVMEPGFEYPSDAQLWTPLGFDRNSFPRQVHALRVVARIAPGETLETAQAEMGRIAEGLAEQYPASNAGRSLLLMPLHEEWIGDLRTPLLVLLTAALLVLLLAALNVANLLLAQALERQGEIQLQRALGASRGRLALQRFCEGALLAMAGGAVGLLLGWLSIRGLVAVSRAQQQVSFLAERLYNIPRLDEVGLDARVVLFALLLMVLVAVLVSLVPVLFLSDRDLARGLRGLQRGTVGTAGVQRLREGLVVAEITLALMLLFNAGLLIRSFQALQQVDLGFDPRGVLTFQVALPPNAYGPPQRTQAFFGELLRQIEAVPGVRSAGLTWGLPLSDLQATVTFNVDGRLPPPPGEENRTRIQPVSEAYFQTLGTPLLAGRHLDARDHAESAPVVLVNRAFVERFFPGEEAVGERIDLGGNFGPLGALPQMPREIAGVVGDHRNVTLGEEPEPEVYLPFRQNTWRMMTVAVRSDGDPMVLWPEMRERVWAIDPDLAPSQAETLGRIVGRAQSQARLHTLILAAFAGVALVLACVGVFGAVAHSVQRRTREFGVRMALGADRDDLVRHATVRGMVLAGVGIALGLVVGIAAARALSALLFATAPTDPWALAAGALVTGALSLLAAWLPARRASLIEPMAALRTQ